MSGFIHQVDRTSGNEKEIAATTSATTGQTIAGIRLAASTVGGAGCTDDSTISDDTQPAPAIRQTEAYGRAEAGWSGPKPSVSSRRRCAASSAYWSAIGPGPATGYSSS